MAKKKPIIFKVASREVRLDLLKTSEQIVGRAVVDEEVIRISSRTASGNKRSLRSKMSFLCHELGHVFSIISGHHIFEGDDDETTNRKEGWLNGFSELMAQTLLDSGMLDKDWLKRFNDLDEEEDSS